MWIKICGNTNLEDCQAAARMGADALGFVFAPGRRTVTAGQVRTITMHLPAALEKIGVFTTGSYTEIAETVREAGLTGIQLHGAFAAGLLRELRAALPLLQRVIQVVHWYTDVPAEQQEQAFARQVSDVEQNGTADAMLTDSRTRTASGGTGVAFDWRAARHILLQQRLPLIVAGGLNAENVGSAITALNAWGVDVASGVEQSAGRKDLVKLAAFIDNARNASPNNESRVQGPALQDGAIHAA